jgi:hypothetical protein
MSDAAGDRVAILQFSAITSSAALQLPVERPAAWGHERDVVVLVDAAHVPGHTGIGSWQGVDAAFGTVHKWLPVSRSDGILWASPSLAGAVHPAETSLTFNDPSLGSALLLARDLRSSGPAVCPRRSLRPDSVDRGRRYLPLPETGRPGHRQVFIREGRGSLSGPQTR